MAKRVPPGEAPYRPLDKVLVQSVLTGVSETADTRPAGGANAAAAVAEAPRVAEPPRAPTSPPPRTNVVNMPASSPAVAPRRTEPVAVVQDLGLERREREKRVLLTRAEERDVERLVDRIAGELNTPVKFSHVLRASITILLHAEEELVERARKSTLIRPGNGNAPELAEFEHGLAQILSTALREAPPVR